MTVSEAQAAILNRSSIEIRTDRKGREFGVFWSRHTGWTRCSLIEAKLILAEREAA